ncbi:MAG: SDR family oxidoreductase [Saprospiraceae bacterium]
MKILLTGATGYIGKRLLPGLVQEGHQVVCCVRDKGRFNPAESLLPFIEIIELDLLDADSLRVIPRDIDAAYYLVHSMSTSKDYNSLEQESATNFANELEKTSAKQVIYLSGIVNADELSEHLQSRKNVERILSDKSFALTTLRAGIIIGSGSASFEIIRDLVEKLPAMIAPKWLNTRCQPIGIRNVIEFLSKALLNEKTYNQNFDIGGPDVLTYKEMLLGFAEARGLKRTIRTVPIMSPKISSYWLYFVTSTSYNLASSLVDSMKVEVVARDAKINDILDVQPEGYAKSIERAFTKIESNEVVSSWKDSQISGVLSYNITDFIDVPTFGCFNDKRSRKLINKELSIEKVFAIGGDTGWYYANILWKIRGFIDQLFGGVGLRRGRANPTELFAGDALDFWRVLYADKEEGRLLLFAEMIVPGEAWLEFKIVDDELHQIATFRPNGLFGRAYWWSVWPLHGMIFTGMLNKLIEE